MPSNQRGMKSHLNLTFILLSVSAFSQQESDLVKTKSVIGFDGSIQTDAKLFTANYHNTVFTVGTGYVWKLYKTFYLNPWAAFHARKGGDNSITVDDQEFTLPAITADVSLKIGWHF